MMLRGGPRTQILQTKSELEKLGVDVQFFDTWGEYRKQDFDLVHLFSAGIGTYHLARNLNLNGIPFVVSPIFFSRHSPRFIRAVLTADRLVNSITRGVWTDFGLMANICSWAQTVLPNTTDESLLFIKGLGVQPDRIKVIPNGVEERFASAKPDLFIKTYGIKDFILNVGHIGPERKNVYRLIEAVEGIDMPVVIIGRIEDTPAARKCLDRAKKNHNLLVLDNISHDSELLASAYAACRVFVLPSQFETPGIAALEAALAGARIVITKYGGTKMYFGEDADYVEYQSSLSIRQGIIRALEKPKSKQLSERILKSFTWKRVAEETKNVYESVLKMH